MAVTTSWCCWHGCNPSHHSRNVTPYFSHHRDGELGNQAVSTSHPIAVTANLAAASKNLRALVRHSYSPTLATSPTTVVVR